MLNYIKSELYRITHSSTVYIAILSFAALPLFANLALFFFGHSKADFPYATTSFSYSNLVSNPMFFCIAALCVVFALYEGNKRNGNLKNVIAFGISREKIFVGQFVVCLIISTVIMVVSIAALILSASLLLQNTGVVVVEDLINEIVAVFPTAIAALILAIVVIQLFDKILFGLITWFGVLYIIPEILYYIGIEVEPIRRVAMWMPNNFFSGMEVNTSVCNPFWDKPFGLETCLIAGAIGIVVFNVLGILALRKKEF